MLRRFLTKPGGGDLAPEAPALIASCGLADAPERAANPCPDQRQTAWLSYARPLCAPAPLERRGFAFLARGNPRPAEAFTLSLGPLKPRADSFLNRRALKLGKDAHHLEKRLAGRTKAVIRETIPVAVWTIGAGKCRPLRAPAPRRSSPTTRGASTSSPPQPYHTDDRPRDEQNN